MCSKNTYVNISSKLYDEKLYLTLRNHPSTFNSRPPPLPSRKPR